MDGGRAEYAGGHVVGRGRRITRSARAGPRPEGATVVDGRGCLITRGSWNTHQHLYSGHPRPGGGRDPVGLVPSCIGVGRNRRARGAHRRQWGTVLAGPAPAAPHSTTPLRVPPRRRRPCLAAGDRGGPRGGRPGSTVRGSMGPGPERRWAAAGQVVEDRDAVLAASAEAVDAGTTRRRAPCCASRSRPARRSRDRELMRDAADLAAAAVCGSHAPGGDPGRGGLLPGTVRVHPAGCTRRPGWTGPTCGSRTPST